MRLAHAASLVVVLAALGCKPDFAHHYTVLPAVGQPVPAFQYPTGDGSSVSAATIRGQPTVLALWSSTCSASRASLVALHQLDSAYRDKGARVVILADDRERAPVDAALARAGVRLSAVLANGSLSDTFTHGQYMLPWRKSFALPTFLVVDGDGRVAAVQVGIEAVAADRLSRVRTVLDSLLGRSQAATVPRPAA